MRKPPVDSSTVAVVIVLTLSAFLAFTPKSNGLSAFNSMLLSIRAAVTLPQVTCQSFSTDATNPVESGPPVAVTGWQ